MKITILGNNGPYPALGGATSGYLLETDKDKFVLDFGSGVFTNLLKHVAPEDLTAIFISHLHFDHVSDLGVLTYYFQLAHARGLQKKITVYFPEKTEFATQIEQSGEFNVIYYGEGSLFEYGGTCFSFCKAVHPVLTFAIKVVSGGKTFLYTADTNFCPQIEGEFSTADLALCDAGFLSRDWSDKKPHMSIKGICELSDKYNVKVILTHLNPRYSHRELLEEAFGSFTIAQIGDIYTL